MDRDTKMLIGKLLGDIYSFRKAVYGRSRISGGTLYGLPNGIETATDGEIVGLG